MLPNDWVQRPPKAVRCYDRLEGERYEAKYSSTLLMNTKES